MKLKSLVGSLALLGLATHALAQAPEQRVTITGSSIKRIQSEGALPVQVITRREIERSGVSSVTELLQNLSVVQGGIVEGDVIGGVGGGQATVSIHNLGGDRTLVLLNGKRLIGEAGGSVDVNMIPLAIVERVEVLTDGASALYGSDAVAGVVNFITKRDYSSGNVMLSASKPEKAGGEEWNASVSKGFGNLDRDGYNLLVSLSADKRKALVANQRDFSKTGVINFQFEGKNYEWFNGSPSGIPGNVVVAGVPTSEYLISNGKCPPMHIKDGPTCYFDYASTVEAFPDRERTNLFSTFKKMLGADTTLGVDLLFGKTMSSGKIAPAPGGVLVDPAGPFGSYLKTVGYTATTPAVVRYRAYDLGNRDSVFDRTNTGLWVSLDGRFGAWDYGAVLGHQKAKTEESNSGYPYGIAFNSLLRSGLWNPFVLPGNQSQAAKDAAAKIMVSGVYDTETSTLTSVDARASRELFKLGGGSAALALGASYMQDEVRSSPSLAAQGKGGANGNDTRFGDAGGAVAYGAERKAFGMFAEVVAPITKQFEVTAGLRYDDYDKVASATNGKVAFRYEPAKSVLLRGSVGTGFRVPTLRQLYRPLQSFGVTAEPYNCSADMLKMATSLGAECQPGKLQYDVFTGGNAKVQPEESKQATLGIRFEPTRDLSFGADLWWVGIDKTFGSVEENEAFANVYKYASLWTTYTDPVTGATYLAYNASTTNLGKSFSTGIDFDITGRFDTPVGKLTSNLRATYMIRDEFQLLPGGTYYTTMAEHNPAIGKVTFRLKGTLGNTLQMGRWAHTLNLNFQSGYLDTEAYVYGKDAKGEYNGDDRTIRLTIKDTYTLDWQSELQWNKALKITAGIKNLTNEKPPLSLRSNGGHMLGFDYRYYNPLGRTFQARVSYDF
ncbi:MAG: TonB-dependent receptor domain-containing protein [Rubrivivax sp.]